MGREKILLVEDNDAVAMGLRYALEKEGYDVTRLATASGTLEHAKGEPFELMVLDIRLPDGSGFDVCRELRTAGIRQPIIMLTARDETIDKVIGLEMGADDYVTKPFDLRELLARIRSQLRRSYGSLADYSQHRLLVGDIALDLSSHRATRGSDEIYLTSTEFRLLTFLAQHSGRPQSRETLLKQVWGYDDSIADRRIVDVHVRNLRRKIEVDPSRPRHIVTIRGAGYKYVP